MAKKKESSKITEICDYCIHNKGENERFKFMWYCENMKRYLPQGYNYCRSNIQQKGEFKIDLLKFNEFNENK